MADTAARELGLDGRGRLLDVGTGPGIVALELAPRFEEVVGLDADAGMLAEAEAEARRQGIENARWAHLRAEDLPAGLGRFRVITMAQSLHWMDQELVAATLHGMLEPTGFLVLVSAYTRRGVEITGALPHPQPPWDAITALVDRYIGSETRAGPVLREQGQPDEDQILGNWFVGPRLVRVADGRILTRTIDQVVAAVYSVSASPPYRFGDRIGLFDADLRELLDEASDGGTFSQQTGDTALRIWSL